MVDEFEATVNRLCSSYPGYLRLQKQNLGFKIFTDLTDPESIQRTQTATDGAKASSVTKLKDGLEYVVKLICKTANFDREYFLNSLCPSLIQNFEIF